MSCCLRKPFDDPVNVAAATIAMIGGFTNGYGASITGGAVARLAANTALSKGQHAFIEGALFSGMVIGCVFGGWMADRFGRRPSTFFGEACVFFFAMFQALSGNSPGLIGGFRILHGFGLGVCVLIKPLYVSELVPAAARGITIGLFAWAYSAGLVTALAIDANMPSTGTGSVWQAELTLVPMCMSAMLALVVWVFLPESPLYLARRQQQREEAESIANAAVGDGADGDGGAVEAQAVAVATPPSRPTVPAAAAAAAAPARAGQQDRSALWIWRMLLCGCRDSDSKHARSPRTAPALAASAVLTAAYQLTGIALIMTDTRHLLTLAELDAASVAKYSVGAGATHFGGVCVGVLLLPHFGRRPLFLGSLLCMVVALLLVAGAYNASPADTGWAWLPQARGGALLLAILAFQGGMAPCFWVITVLRLLALLPTSNAH
jgi:MFS family permease